MGTVSLAIFFLSCALFSCASDVPPSFDGGSETEEITHLPLGLGENHTCAVSQNSILKCWGLNILGQLGDGSTDSRRTPVPINLGNGRSVRALALGNFHSCAILDDHSVSCWGSNLLGQIGDPDIVGSSLTPIPVDLGEEQSAKAIASGGDHTCALLNNHSLKCWGQNDAGQLGDGSGDPVQNSPTPVALGTNRRAKAITAGRAHTCAILDDDTLWCWGKNGVGQLGDKSNDDRNTPVPIDLGEGRSVRTVVSRENHTCAILDNYTLKCWGENGDGELGDQKTADNHTPTLVELGDAKVLKVTVGNGFSCTQTGNYALRCWGTNNFGELADGTNNPRNTLDTTSNLPPGRAILSIQSGYNHTCVRLEDGSLLCWGNNNHGKLGVTNSQLSSLFAFNPLEVDLDS